MLPVVTFEGTPFFELTTVSQALLLISLLAMPPAPGCGDAAPAPSTPKALRELWLRFHEAELCQSLDAVFSYHRDGLEIWVQYEDDRSYQRLTEMTAPLRGSFRVDIYATKYVPEKKGPDDNQPPPSLWNNAELQRYFQDPVSGIIPPETGPPPGVAPSGGDYFIKQRMLMFAGQTLDWNRKLRRYAADLPDLAAAGFGKESPDDLRLRAVEVCRNHAEALDRMAERILTNMTVAIPRPGKKGKTEAASSPNMPTDALAAARQLSSTALTLTRRIQQFMFPRRHTVDLGDLKEPGMLESLRTFRTMVQRFLANTARR